MNKKIKQRIELIRQGKAPEGYKRTKLGIVPKEWEVKSIDNCIQEYNVLSNDIHTIPVCTSSRKGLILQSQYFNQKNSVETNIGYKVVPINYVTYRHMSDDDVFHFNQNHYKSCVLVSSEYPVFTVKSGVCTIYLLALFNETAHFRFFCRMQKQGGTRTRLYLKNLYTYKTYFPPLPEQERIAEILSTQDRVIELKEKRIAEKKLQKKYLMQTLLTGKVRLKGFKEKWKHPLAKEIFKNVSDKNHKGEFEILSATQDRGVILRTQLDIDIKYNKESVVTYKHVRKGDFVISLRSFQGGIEYSEYEGLISPAYIVLQENCQICHIFYKEFFKSPNYIRRLGVAIYGIRDGKQIGYNDFGVIPIPFPSLPEQQAIADILSAADQEIKLLEQDLEQEKQKKKALMQLLLTGIVRTCNNGK